MAFPADYSTLDTDIADATSTDNADLGKDHATAHNELHGAVNDLFTQADTNEAYNATTWNGSKEFPTKDAVRDKVETLAPLSAVITASQCLAYKNGGTQSVSNTTHTAVTLDAEEFDDDAYHNTSSANLTGTVAKTASSATLTGTGTAFSTELSVGQMISVPGTAAEVRVVTAIASDTSLTVNSAFANTASGQTAARVNSGLVVPVAGRYRVDGQIEYAAGTQWSAAAPYFVMGFLWLNGVGTGTRLCQHGPIINSEASTPPRIPVSSGVRSFAQWDYVELGAYHNHNGGSARNVTSSQTAGSTFLSIERVG